jgi:hypothetical protein
LSGNIFLVASVQYLEDLLGINHLIKGGVILTEVEEGEFSCLVNIDVIN